MVIEGVLYELRNSSEEKKCHTHYCVRLDNKYSRELGGEINKRAVWEGHKDAQYKQGIF